LSLCRIDGPPRAVKRGTDLARNYYGDAVRVFAEDVREQMHSQAPLASAGVFPPPLVVLLWSIERL